MNRFRYLFLVFCLICSSSVFSQKVVKVKRPYVLVEMSKRKDFKVGDQLLVFRSGFDSEDKLIGLIKILVFKNNQCATEIVKENTTDHIQVGDYVVKYRKKISSKRDEKPAESVIRGSDQFSIDPVQYKSQWPSYFSFTVGLISSGIGYYYFNEAEKSSIKFHSTQEEHDQLVKDTRKFDNRANFCYGLGGGLIVYGVINYFITRHYNKKYFENFSIVPVQKGDYYGIGLRICLNFVN